MTVSLKNDLIVICTLFALGFLCWLISSNIDQIDKWQTLLSAIIALGAAGATIKTMQRQIKEEIHRHANEKASHAMSYRLRMPLAAGQIMDYTETAFEALCDLNATTPPP